MVDEAPGGLTAQDYLPQLPLPACNMVNITWVHSRLAGTDWPLYELWHVHSHVFTGGSKTIQG